MMNDDMRAVIDGQRLCFAATVDEDGRPNLSPKGTIRVWDDRHLYFCDIASPNTRRNLERNPWIELNVVDGLSRRGYRFRGKATLHTEGPVYETATRRITADEGDAYPIHAVVLIEVERALPLVSPGYRHVADEHEMRETWKERRAELDTAFERHLDEQGPLRGHPPSD